MALEINKRTLEKENEAAINNIKNQKDAELEKCKKDLQGSAYASASSASLHRSVIITTEPFNYISLDTLHVLSLKCLLADFDKKLEQFKKDQQSQLEAEKKKITDNFGKELKEFQNKQAADLEQEKKKLSEVSV